MVKQTTINYLLLFVSHLNVSADVLSEETKVMSGKKLSQKQTNKQMKTSESISFPSSKFPFSLGASQSFCI